MKSEDGPPSETPGSRSGAVMETSTLGELSPPEKPFVGHWEAVPASSYHIVETPGAIDWRNEVTLPTEEYYTALKADMDERHPQASKFVLDHLISLEALLDISILSGFSFGLDKAKPFAILGQLLGDWVGRKGRWPTEDKIQAIKEFAPIKEKKQLQQLLGCTNWVRFYLKEVYPTLIKMIGHLLKDGYKFPDEGFSEQGTRKRRFCDKSN